MVPMAPSATMARRASCSRNSSARVVEAVGIGRYSDLLFSGAAGPDTVILAHVRRWERAQGVRGFRLVLCPPGPEVLVEAASAESKEVIGWPAGPGKFSRPQERCIYELVTVGEPKPHRAWQRGRQPS